MGCDIHLYIEVLEPDSDSWDMVAEIWLARYYDLFGRMAGARRLVEPIAKPRGFPSDADELTASRYDDWAGDAHHESWLTTQEIAQLVTEFPSNVHLQVIAAYMQAFEANAHTARAVFWFDN